MAEGQVHTEYTRDTSVSKSFNNKMHPVHTYYSYNGSWQNMSHPTCFMIPCPDHSDYQQFTNRNSSKGGQQLIVNSADLGRNYVN